MDRPSVYAQEFRDRAVNLVVQATPEHPSESAAIETIARQLGVSGETLRKWVRRAEVNSAQRPGLTSDQLEELKRLQRDNAQLRRKRGAVLGRALRPDDLPGCAARSSGTLKVGADGSRARG